MNKRPLVLRLLSGGALFAAATTCSLPANTAVTPEARDGRFHQRYVERARQGGIDVLFIGDSITQYWTDADPGRGGLEVWRREFAPLRAANFGVNGERTQHILWRLQNGEGEGYSPKAVVLLVGTNNTGKERGGSGPRNTVAEIVEGVTTIVDELRARFPDAGILVLGLLPRWPAGSAYRAQIDEVNVALGRRLEGRLRVRFLQCGERFLRPDGEVNEALMPDKIHPNPAGYEILAEAIRAPLHEMLGKQEKRL